MERWRDERWYSIPSYRTHRFINLTLHAVSDGKIIEAFNFVWPRHGDPLQTMEVRIQRFRPRGDDCNKQSLGPKRSRMDSASGVPCSCQFCENKERLGKRWQPWSAQTLECVCVCCFALLPGIDTCIILHTPFVISFLRVAGGAQDGKTTRAANMGWGSLGVAIFRVCFGLLPP